MDLYGKKPVLERIRSDPGSIKKLYLQRSTDLSEIVREAKNAGINFVSVEKSWLRDKYGGANTQGIMAVIDDFNYVSFTEILSDCVDRSITPIFLDGVTDPQNLGSIIRNLACMGGFSIVLPEHNSAHVNETVLRVSCGGENHIKICKVKNSVNAVNAAKDKGIWIVGAAADNSENLIDTELATPLAVVIGSEGKGIRPGIKKCLDISLSLPMSGAPLSYNVAVAASLFCYELIRRKHGGICGK